MVKKQVEINSLPSKKMEMLQKVCAQIQKNFGKESVNFLGNNKVTPIPRITSGSTAIDKVTGGGYPLGRTIELFGGASVGKTTACYHAIAEAQKAFPDKWCGFIDSEYSFDAQYAANIGVNVGELMIAQPDSGTDGFSILQSFVENGASLIVVDSVAAMVPREEVVEEDYGKASMASQARMMSKALRKLTAIIGKHKCVVIFTNQTREKVGVTWGNPEVVSGGKALGFYSSIRLKLSKLGVIEEGDKDEKEKVSVRTKVEAVKNKTFPPFRTAEYIVVFGKGIDNDAGVLDEAIERGMIVKKGGWYSIDGENVAQGLNNLKIYLAEHPDIFNKFKEEIKSSEPKLEMVVDDSADSESMSDDEISQKIVDNTESGSV